MPGTTPLPQSFGKYTLVDRIAAGGMAEVYRAKLFGVAGFEKTVAVKRILPHFAEDDGFVDMFVREANIAVRLTHSNIVQVFELGRVGDHYFIALEFVEGSDLKSLVRKASARGRPLPAPVAAYIGQKICAGLHHAHTATDEEGNPLGIVHRDVSPHNVLVSWGGEVKVADFGIAKLKSGVRHTRTGMIKGKLSYMSPEQAEGDPGLDARSDVFAAGIVLYECLTGFRPFEGSSDREILRAVRGVTPPAPSSIDPAVPPELDEIVGRAMAKGLDERYPDAGAMARALGSCLQRLGSSSGRPVDEEDVAGQMSDLLGARTGRPRPSSPDFAIRGPESPEPTPILSPAELGENSAPSLAPTRASVTRLGPGDRDLPSLPGSVPGVATRHGTAVAGPSRDLASRTGEDSVLPSGMDSTIRPGKDPASQAGSEHAGRSGKNHTSRVLGIAILAGGFAVLGAIGIHLGTGVEPSEKQDPVPTAYVGASSKRETAPPSNDSSNPPAEPAGSSVAAASIRPTVASRTPPTGSLKIDGTPKEASIRIGGRQVGSLGATIPGLPEGAYQVTVSAEHFRSRTVPVEVKAHSTATRRVDLVRGRGKVRIASPVRSAYEIEIPGVTRNAGGGQFDAPAGVYAAKVSDGGRTYAVTVVVKDAETTMVSLPRKLQDGLTFRP